MRILNKFIKYFYKIFLNEKSIIEYEINCFEKAKKKENIKNYYSIITSVYNCEKYLDEYFDSIINQKLNFRKYIQIIVINDGSTDNSLEIIKRWKNKYDQNIVIVSCENSGQANARNIGINFVKSPWITFVDADDFISENYFSEVNKFLNQNENISAVSCNQIFYYEESKLTKDHYLSFRFKSKSKIVNPTDMKGYLQTTASSIFFQTALIKKHKLFFDKKVVPIYEDGHFVNRLFIYEPKINIAFLQKPTYYWRKRENETSTMDNAWKNEKRYYDALKFGLLDLLNTSNEINGHSPVYLQRFVLYHISWYFNKIIFQDFSIEFLSNKQKDDFFKILKDLMNYVDDDTLAKAKLGAMYHKIKLGMINLFEKKDLYNTQIFYIDAFDKNLDNLSIRFYQKSQEDFVNFKSNNNIINSSNKSIKSYYFLNHLFIYEIKINISVKDIIKELSAEYIDKKIYFSINKTWYENKIDLNKIKELNE